MDNGQDTRKWQASGRWRWLTSAVLAVFVLLSGLVSPSGAQMEEGGLRLTPDVSPEGRDMVEIYHDDEWRGVCDDFWGPADAQVVCRQLGYDPVNAEAVRPLDGPSPVKMWLDDVGCDGSEEKLIDCGHSGWGRHNCGPGEYAGVRCGAKAKMVDLSERHLTVNEADTTSIDYTVKLSGAPDDDVAVTVAVEGDNVLVDKTTLTFTAMNYSTAQTITVTTQDDGNAVDDTVIITHTPSGGGYDATSIASVRVTVLDNDATVPGRIAAPAVATLRDATLVGWRRPADTGGAALTGYEVRSIKTADDETVDDNWTVQHYAETVRRATLTGLLSGTTYEVQVRAMNRKGYGAWSASGTLTTRPARPGAPTVTAESVTRLHVEWAGQAAHEVAVIAYDVQYRQAGQPAGKLWPHVGTARQTTITGLRAGTVYRVQVRARNAGGASPWSGTGTGGTAANTPAAGQPTISGTPRAGQTLTVSASGIMDADGLSGALFAWQWFSDDGNGAVAIADATGTSYTLTAAEVGHTLTVHVTFTDTSLTGFPTAGEAVLLVWQQASQNFVLAPLDREPPPASPPSPVSGPPGVLENPGPGSRQSGLGLLSGWVCEADVVEVEINGGSRIVAAYGTDRADTVRMCGDTDNGFGLLFNWNLLGDGVHTVRALADGAEFGRATFTVTTLGVEFLQGRQGETVVADFPSPGEAVRLIWQQANQNFVLAPLP